MRWLLLGVSITVQSLGVPARGGPAATKPARMAGRAGAVVVYACDFEKPVGPEWSRPATEVTVRGKRRFLGRFGNHEVRLMLKRLPAHRRLRISLELFILRSWDGHDTGQPGVGPDIWRLAVDGCGALLCTSFANTALDSQNKQTFPDPCPGPLHPPQTAASERNSLGDDPKNAQYGNAVYRLSFTLPHRGEQVTFAFASSGLEALHNEAWGLDNVKVEALPAAAPVGEARLRQRWKALEGDDAAASFEAYRELMAAGEQAAAFLAQRLRPEPVDAAAVRRLIADLNASRWADREKASQALRKLGPAAEPYLRQARKGKLTAEVASRIDALLAELDRKDVPPRLLARQARLIRLLRMLGGEKSLVGLDCLRRFGRGEKVRHLAAVAADGLAHPMIGKVLRAADEQARALRLETAKASCRDALRIAKLAQSTREAEVSARLARLEDLAGARGKLREQDRQWRANPGDRALRERLIRLCLVELDSPKAAAAYLDSRCDATWRRLVPLAAKDAELLDPPEALALAEWYVRLAEGAGRLGKPAVLRRARQYYRLYARALQASVDAAEASAGKIEDHLAELGDGPWLDLLRQVRLDLLRVSGVWRMNGRALHVQPGEFARMALPLRPRGDYELRAEFARKTGQADVNFILPVGSTSVLVCLDDTEGDTALQYVDGKDLSLPDARVSLRNGKTHRFRATVRTRGGQTTLDIRLDGRRLLHWRGPTRALTVRSAWAVRHEGALGVGAHKSTVEFIHLRLRMLTGRAEKVPVSLLPPPKPRRVYPPGVTLLGVPVQIGPDVEVIRE